ncbi:MAG: CBS domain-containing protein [Candidatus Verstraetearchaeota archaeon]|nr:CBS domain-containing protein [Candidatus Verstraetearchaeota archaeon]
MFPPAEYLSKVKPFSLLQKAELAELVSRMDVEFYKQGKAIFRRGERTERLYFVREGKIGLFSEAGLEEVVEKDELLGVDAAKSGWMPEYDGKALEDAVVFVLESAAARLVAERNEGFRDYIESLSSKRFLHLMGTSLREKEGSLHRPVCQIVGRSPVFCSREGTLMDAIRLMVEQRVGSVIVVGPGMEPLGIVTHSDVLRHINDGSGALEPVERAMSSPVITVGARSSVLDAYVKFISHGVNHLAVVDDGKLTGVISIKDLVSSLEVHSYFFRVTKGAAWANPGEFVTPEKGINEVIRNASKRGLDYPSISAIVARLADAAAKKAISQWFGDPEIGSAVMFTGELGRGEFSFPFEAGLLVVGSKRVEGLQEALSKVGIHVRNVDCCDADMKVFLGTLRSERLLELIDTRYILGDNHACLRFRDALRERVQQETQLEKVMNIAGSRKEAGALLREIADGVKTLACRHGDLVPKPTWERIETLGSQGLIPLGLSETLKETYIALRTFELMGKVCGEEGRVDRNVHKKVIKTAMEQIKCLKELMSWG